MLSRIRVEYICVYCNSKIQPFINTNLDAVSYKLTPKKRIYSVFNYECKCTNCNEKLYLNGEIINLVSERKNYPISISIKKDNLSSSFVPIYFD